MTYIERLLIAVCALTACNSQNNKHPSPVLEITSPTLVVLGTVQDGGSPHIGCSKPCCRYLFNDPDPDRMVVSLGIIDPTNNSTWILEATPDFPRQIKILKEMSGVAKEIPNGIFLTHAHIGHYTGLMYLGREALGADSAAVYAMPKMNDFLLNNGPWNQLIELNNIVINPLKERRKVNLSSNVSITPLVVPHRDEFSETVGFKINGPTKSILFIPDIDKWNKWEIDIKEEIKQVDYALIDATFYDTAEVGYRDIAEIPHPFVVESMNVFDKLSAKQKSKIYFIHFNHTNPLLRTDSDQYHEVQEKGYGIARFKQTMPL